MSDLTPRVDWSVVSGGHPLDEVGGYKTPVELVEHFEAEVRQTFPINSVPPEVVIMVAEIKRDAQKLSGSMHRLSEVMRDLCGHVQEKPSFIHLGFGPRGGAFVGSMCSESGVLSNNMSEVTCPACRKVMFDTSHRG